jgi:hypothetical protein
MPKPLDQILPFKDGQIVTAEDWNTIFEAIRNGTFFLSNQDPLIEQISNLASKVSSLEDQVAYLSNYLQTYSYEREKFILTDLQPKVTLRYAPLLNSELVILNTTVRSRKILQNDEEWDYYIDGADIIFNPTLVSEISDGDVLEVVYKRA